MLETQRLVLRGFQEKDWKDLYEYLSLESVVRYEPYNPFTEEEAKREASRRVRDESFWAVCLKDSGKLIGNLYFRQVEPEEFMEWELGFVFNPAYHGKGYATESCKKIIEYGLGDLGVRRVVSVCNPENFSSWRLLERLGMRREGHFLKNIYFKRDRDGNPIWQDTYQYALLNPIK